ncbi:MAG: hypothetical protein KA469_01075 [Phycisphaerae bacterium]|nr:hypothetical protein [Phycisphaerae bacterium]
MNAPASTAVIQNGAGWSRTELLFVSTAAMLLTGIFLPWPPQVLDILWILQLSLTAAVVLTCLLAQNSSQLDGFPLLTAAASLLSFLAGAGCMKTLVLRGDTCGRLIGMTGRAIAAFEPLLALLVVFLIGFFLLYLVHLASKRMRLAVEHYFNHILPVKKAGLDTDRSLQILTAEQAQVLLNKIRKEVRFYASMEQIRKLLLTQITVNLFLVLAACPLAWLAEALQAASAPSSSSPLQTLAPPLTAAALLSWIPAAITAISCAALLSKESLALPRIDSAKETAQSRKIKIISSSSGRTEEVELLNPDSLRTVSAEGAPVERIADFEPSPPDIPSAMLPEIHLLNLQCRSAEEYYRRIEEFFSQPAFHQSFLLLTAESVKDLPVSVVVHPAVRLARQKKNVLLLDADPRNAIAKVFALEPSSLSAPRPVPHLEHLWLQSIRPENCFQMAAEPPQIDFQCRLVYAPQRPTIRPQPQGQTSRAVHVLFFSTEPPARVQPLFAGISAIRGVYVIDPLSAALSKAD